MRASVVGPSTSRTSTWLSTTSFSTVNPPAASASAIVLAAAQLRATNSATPCRPSVRSTAHTSTCRARCEDCGVWCIASNWPLAGR